MTLNVGCKVYAALSNHVAMETTLPISVYIELASTFNSFSCQNVSLRMVW